MANPVRAGAQPSKRLLVTIDSARPAIVY